MFPTQKNICFLRFIRKKQMHFCQKQVLFPCLFQYLFLYFFAETVQYDRMERINGSEWVWNIVNTYDSEVRNISDRLSFEKMLLWVNTRGMVMNKEIRSDKRIKNIIGIIKSCLILILIFLIVFMIIQINR